MARFIVDNIASIHTRTNMERSSNWSVGEQKARQPILASTHVMAWARDIETGEPVYIMELDASRTGSKCGCDCPSCDLPLTAVNAAKKAYKRRPHFRHPDGTEKSECMYLSARLAALQLLRDQGFLLLPQRRQSANSVGLSGTQYEAWVDRPPERVAIRNFNFSDKASAILTLDDGRKLRFTLIGDGATLADDGELMATIRLDLADPSIASMSMEDIRSRITLLPDDICWMSHWNDDELLAQAKIDADQKANEFMDLQGAYADDLRDIDKKSRHETVLHFEVKRILSESMSLRVPSMDAVALGESKSGVKIEREWTKPSEVIHLLNVQLEKRTGRLIPDVIAITSDSSGGILMIEITVTNHLNEIRLERIRGLNIPTLEIDLSQSGGLVSRDELRHLVLDGLELKRWVHHPEKLEQARQLEAQVAETVRELDQVERNRLEHLRTILATPLSEIAHSYLDAIAVLAQYECEKPSQETRSGEAAARVRVDAEANRLAIHGYAEANDRELTLGRESIIPRVLSIKQGKGVGYKLDSTMKVMNAIKQSALWNRKNHSIYMIAEKVYRQEGAADTPKWYEDWTNEVRNSIRSGDGTYLRDGRYDKLLSLLFPEMAVALSKKLKRSQTFSDVEIQKFKSAMKRQGSNLASLNAQDPVQRIQAEYSYGYYRDSGQRVDFDQILSESKALRQGEDFFKWFEIWSDRYSLAYDVHPVARLLEAAGFTDAIEKWHQWNKYIQDGKLRSKYQFTPAEVAPPVSFNSDSSNWYSKPSKPLSAPNLYAEMKGRDKPRTPNE